jgi:hypothetical protein
MPREIVLYSPHKFWLRLAPTPGALLLRSVVLLCGVPSWIAGTFAFFSQQNFLSWARGFMPALTHPFIYYWCFASLVLVIVAWYVGNRDYSFTKAKLTILIQRVNNHTIRINQRVRMEQKIAAELDASGVKQGPILNPIRPFPQRLVEELYDFESAGWLALGELAVDLEDVNSRLAELNELRTEDVRPVVEISEQKLIHTLDRVRKEYSLAFGGTMRL